MFRMRSARSLYCVKHGWANHPQRTRFVVVHRSFLICGIRLANETLLVGQIFGPTSDAARNLQGMLLSIDVFHNETALHQSLLPIEQQTFPLNYSVVLTKDDFDIDKDKTFSVVAMIWQPAYISEQKVKLLENEKDSLATHMQGIRQCCSTHWTRDE